MFILAVLLAIVLSIIKVAGALTFSWWWIVAIVLAVPVVYTVIITSFMYVLHRLTRR